MGTACRPINAAGTETSSCNGPNECDRGFVCLGGSAFASCKKYCTGDADCGLPRGKCVFTINGDSGPIAGAPNACSSNCDPTDTTAAGCPSTMKCTLYTVTKASVPINIADCSPAGAMVQGGDCTAPGGASGIEARCAKGFQCVKFSSESVFKCRKLCTAGTSTCGANTCVAFTPVFTLDAKDYGVCGP